VGVMSVICDCGVHVRGSDVCYMWLWSACACVLFRVCCRSLVRHWLVLCRTSGAVNHFSCSRWLLRVCQFHWWSSVLGQLHTCIIFRLHEYYWW